ncbi:MAG: hypothetical protein RJQ08_11235 [Salinisphaeraceae bacterium]|uniref:Lipoprotein n=1 Tax=Spectribacter acetivorans TaxID=3075603 RepID=A0ABU3BC84_9GAMM|nr:hypothetical protein [Salinisphaera sp. P385]MDT0618586.1 hypothetical protein [Salinisphaera sp. P385]
MNTIKTVLLLCGIAAVAGCASAPKTVDYQASKSRAWNIAHAQGLTDEEGPLQDVKTQRTIERQAAYDKFDSETEAVTAGLGMMQGAAFGAVDLLSFFAASPHIARNDALAVIVPKAQAGDAERAESMVTEMILRDVDDFLLNPGLTMRRIPEGSRGVRRRDSIYVEGSGCSTEICSGGAPAKVTADLAPGNPLAGGRPAYMVRGYFNAYDQNRNLVTRWHEIGAVSAWSQRLPANAYIYLAPKKGRNQVPIYLNQGRVLHFRR